MNPFEVGQIVISKCGRDKGRAFIVVAIEENYVYIVDGDLRKLEAPKRKKYKHIQGTNEIIDWIKQKIIESGYLLDSDIRKVLKDHKMTASI